MDNGTGDIPAMKMDDDESKMDDDESPNGTNPPKTTIPRASTRIGSLARIAWTERWTTLAPALGHTGVTAIYLRALQCTETEYPWLYEVREQSPESNPFAPLLASLARCTPGTAAAAQASLLEQFDRQLTLLVGEPLAQRLLAPDRAGDEGASPPAPPHHEIAAQLTLSGLRADADARLARRERDQARRSCVQDDLTGAANRRCMLDRLTSAIALADRTGTPAAVLFIDLDGFKRVNDQIGHRTGDDMLRRVAARLQAAVRKTDTVCRYGGDEFVVLLTPMERQTEATPAAARLLRAIAEVGETNPAVPALAASIGIALYPEDGTDSDALLSRADRSMYRHKCSRRHPRACAHADSPHAQTESPWPGDELVQAYGPISGPTYGD